MRLVLTIAIAATVTLTGCDQLARFTRVTSIPTSASARHNAQGEPGLVAAVGWAPSRDGRGFGTWTWDPAIDRGCNEHEVEPAAELDNDGALCRSFVP